MKTLREIAREFLEIDSKNNAGVSTLLVGVNGKSVQKVQGVFNIYNADGNYIGTRYDVDSALDFIGL